MKYVILCLCLLRCLCASAQSNDVDTAKSRSVYQYVEKMPKPDFDMGNYLSKALHYPNSALKNNIQGRVLIKFVVNEDGSISDCVVLKGIGGGCDEEALKAVKNMPAWNPGIQYGKPVKVYFTQPITFALDESKQKKNKKVDPTTKHIPADKGPEAGYNWTRYIERHLHYPDAAHKNNITGTVIIAVTVNEDGSFSDIKVKKGIGAGCDEEALRIVSTMPAWQPAMQQGKAVKADTEIPVPFTLDE